MENQITEFKEKFLEIKNKGWNKTHRNSDTGIGKTFEDLMGIKENNHPGPDFKNFEIKCHRKNSNSKITLFTLSPKPKGVNNKLRELYGESYEDHPEILKLNVTFSADKFYSHLNSYCFKMNILNEENKIKLLVKNYNTSEIYDSIAYYKINDIFKKLKQKNENMIIIEAENKKIKGIEYFKYTKGVLYSGISLEKFLNELKKGTIVYDMRMGVYKSGKNYGKPHDHGSGFRIILSNIANIYNEQLIL